MEDSFKCVYCGEKIRKSQIEGTPQLSDVTDFVTRCPYCGLNTPLPFLMARDLGARIPGED